MRIRRFTRNTASVFISLIMLMILATPAFASTISENNDFNTHYDVLEQIDKNSDWDYFFRLYKTGEEMYARWYEEYVDGGTIEEFKSFSRFEQFLWVDSYLRFAYAINTDKEMYMGSEEKFEKNIISNVTNAMLDYFPHQEEVKTAYIAIANMQYAYYLENGYPYNYLNNKSYLDEGNMIVTEEKNNDTPLLTNEDIDELFTEEEQKDIMEAFGVKSKPNNNVPLLIIGSLVLIIGVAVGVAVVVAVVIFVKKKK